MPVDVRVEPVERLDAHASVSIAYTVRSVFDVVSRDAGFELIEVDVDPWVKDYDQLEPATSWPTRFDVSSWGLLGAYEGRRRVGGAVVAPQTPELHLLDDDDVAVLVDLRVAPQSRDRGTGAALFGAVERWCTDRAFTHLAVETQNVNVAACRFYARQGCELRVVERRAYRDLPDEVKLVWAKCLNAPHG